MKIPKCKRKKLRPLMEIYLDIERWLGRLGFDKTAKGWMNIRTEECYTLEGVIDYVLGSGKFKEIMERNK